MKYDKEIDTHSMFEAPKLFTITWDKSPYAVLFIHLKVKVTLQYQFFRNSYERDCDFKF